MIVLKEETFFLFFRIFGPRGREREGYLRSRVEGRGDSEMGMWCVICEAKAENCALPGVHLRGD